MRPWHSALTLLTCMSVAACSTPGTRRIEERPGDLPPEVLELLNPLPAFDPNLMQPGPERLPDATGDDVPSLVRNHVESAAIYHDGRRAHVGLIGQARERERLEAERLERARQAIAVRNRMRGQK